MNKMATEKRLIDANAYPCQTCEVSYCHQNCAKFIAWFEKTVDAVEVVRCRDCKHYMTIHCTCDGCCISDDWYCADGERRTDHV